MEYSEYFSVIMQVLGGLGLFLYGMSKLSKNMGKVAGKKMKSVMKRFAGNRFSSVGTGIGVTALNQSSSVTTVMVVGFINGGVMTLQQSVGIILGAHIGSTVTSQLAALDIALIANTMFGLGFGLWFWAKGAEGSKKYVIRRAGQMAMGLALIFIGMATMKDAMMPLRESAIFIDAMTGLQSPIAAILIGAVFTALVQSSAATTVIVIGLATQGMLSLEIGVAITLGANIGTCATAILACLAGATRQAWRAAIVHITTNVLGVLLWVAFIPYLAAMVSTTAGGDVGHQIANAHTLFNVVNTALFIWFSKEFAKLAEIALPVLDNETQ